MKLLTTLTACLLSTSISFVAAEEMERLMALKVAQREAQRAKGVFDSRRNQPLASFQPCVNGKAGEYSCDKVDLHGFLTHEEMASTTREGNDVWGKLTR